MYLFAVWAVCFFYWLFGRGAFFCYVGRSVFCFCCLGGCVFILFAVRAGCVIFVLLFGRGFVFFSVWTGDGSSLTYRSAWLVLKGTNNKRDQTAKKKKASSRASHCDQAILHEALHMSPSKVGWTAQVSSSDLQRLQRHPHTAIRFCAHHKLEQVFEACWHNMIRSTDGGKQQDEVHTDETRKRLYGPAHTQLCDSCRNLVKINQ